MYPNLFLRTFWKTDLRSQIFVAMSFAEVYERRFREVIGPAIEAVQVNGFQLKPLRIDLSKTGDSILTDIMDGIAHSEMFLADISSVGYDSKTAEPYRNGNVMYEIGLAVACRQPAEILLIRDDRHKCLFDVSTIPHKYIDFTDPVAAQRELHEELIARLKERNYIADARVKIAIATLSAEEKQVIERFAKYGQGQGFGFLDKGRIDFTAMAAIPRLLDKQLIQTFAAGDDGRPVYRWTRLGYVVAKSINLSLPKVAWDRPTVEEVGESEMEKEKSANT
jgi:hypothetical protein